MQAPLSKEDENKVIQKGLSDKNQPQRTTYFKSLIADASVPLAILVLIIVTTIIEPKFASMSNILSVSQQIAPLAIVAIGQAIVIISGGFDLSVGSIIGFAGILAAYGALWAGPVGGLIIGMLAGGLLGAVNGTIISRFNVSPFVITLGMYTAARGLALIITDGLTVYNLPPSFSIFGRQVIVGILPVSVIIAALACIFGWLYLNRFKSGQYTYAVGGNEEAAYLAGVNVRRIKFQAYFLSGLLAGLAAVVMVSRTGAALPNAGVGVEMDTIAAAIIGGILLGGGSGKISQAIWGFILIGLLANALNLIGVSSYLQMVVTGAIIVVAVIFDRIRKSKTELGG